MYGKFLYRSIPVLLVMFTIFFIIQIHTVNADTLKSKYDVPSKPSIDNSTHFKFKADNGIKTANIPASKIFKITPKVDSNGFLLGMTMSVQPELKNVYKNIGFDKKTQKTVVIYPVFTQAAYSDNGFYRFYEKKCDTSCLTVNIPNSPSGGYSNSLGGAIILNLLNYSQITDIDVDKNPSILKKYNKIIVLHNEYVTKTEFNAITSHPNVVYLYPNALFAQVNVDYDHNAIKLVRGHGYPTTNIQNGFGWSSDNSKFEYDLDCNNWNFVKIKNGKMLNCYPEYRLTYDQSLLEALKKS